MAVVAAWGPGEAIALQDALRLTNEVFAEQLGVAPRTIAKWRANPAMAVSRELQQALDTMLSRSDALSQARFELLVGDGARAEQGATAASLEAATHLHSSLAWLDRLSNGRDAFDDVVKSRTAQRDPSANAPDRRQVADVLHTYYEAEYGEHAPVDVIGPGSRTRSTILSSPNWLNLAVDLRDADQRFTYQRADEAPSVQFSDGLYESATRRLAQCLAGGTRFVDGTLYRLSSVHNDPAGGLGAEFSLGSFAQYALTWDLLEAETFTAASREMTDMPLRDQLLPSVESVLSPGDRLCMGGALALAAFARPATRQRPADYTVLVQSRGDRVLNATQRLAVIPKCFHEPGGDIAEDVSPRVSLIRELEEELFGREEVDHTLSSSGRIADPLHISRVTEPMRWLLENESSWSMDLTGFGYNLLTGNYEFASLIAVHDVEFWERFGGLVEANWESSSITRISAMDATRLEDVATDGRWSDEGLFAFLGGLHRLGEIAPNQACPPNYQIGITS